MPIIGSLAGASSRGLGGFRSFILSGPSSYESIATIIASGSESSVTFSSIPQTFTHLQLRYMSSDARTISNSPIDLRFNGSSATAYNKHYIQGDGTGGASGNELNTSHIRLEGGGSSSPSQAFGIGITDILDYTSTTKTKSILQIAGVDKGNEGFVRVNAGQWYASPTAITSITLIPLVPNLRSGSHFALYGIKES